MSPWIQDISANAWAAPDLLFVLASLFSNTSQINLKNYFVFSTPIFFDNYPIAFAATVLTSNNGSPITTSNPPTIKFIYGTRSSLFYIKWGKPPIRIDAYLL